MFDLEELEKLKTMGATRVRYPDGAEVEFEPWRPWLPNGSALSARVAADDEPTPPAQMPSRDELKAEVAKLTSAADGAPAVTP